MNKGFRKHPEAGTSSLFIGDPTQGEDDIDKWFNSLIGVVEPPYERKQLFGSDAGLCARKNVFHQYNKSVPFEKSPSTQAYMAIGTALENLLAESLHRHDKLLAQNMRLITIPEVKIGGKIDLVCFDHEDELSLIEVKSCGVLPVEPKPTHLSQAQIYCAVSGIRRAWLTYVSRNVRSEFGPNLSMKTFEVDASENILHERLRIASYSVLCGRNRLLPQVPSNFRKTKECDFCSYIDFCWLNKKEGTILESDIRNITVEEEERYSDEANEIATKLMYELGHRYKLTIQGLLKIHGLPKEFKTKLKKLL